jgi:hypothetical protein
LIERERFINRVVPPYGSCFLVQRTSKPPLARTASGGFFWVASIGALFHIPTPFPMKVGPQKPLFMAVIEKPK